MRNDLISKQAAIDAFNTGVDELIVAGKGNAEAVEKYLNGVIDMIKELPSAEQWTPCNERLPKETGKYLVCGCWRGKPTEIWICEYITLGTINGWRNNAENPVVSYWMPLPDFCTNCEADI